MWFVGAVCDYPEWLSALSGLIQRINCFRIISMLNLRLFSSAASVDSFKQLLKTHLFEILFPFI